MRVSLASFQWFIFILAGSVVAPLTIGAAFGMSVPEISSFVQRTFFVIGIISLFQAWFGHKKPIVEGPAVLWWGVFLLFAGLGSAVSSDGFEVLRSIEMGMLFSGVLFILLSMFRVVHRIKRIFTPIVTGTYFILLVAQISGPFMKGILGVGYFSDGVHGTVAVLGIVTALVTIWFATSGWFYLKSYSVLFGIAVGWLLFILFGLEKKIPFEAENWVTFPGVFVWGTPALDLGIMITSAVVTLLLLINFVASIDVVEEVLGDSSDSRYNQSGIVMGISQLLSGVFSTIGMVPLSYTAGFILSTRMKERFPFVLGSLILLGLSFFPTITMFFASIPVPVGYASMLLAFSNMLVIGLQAYMKIDRDQQSLFIISLSLMIGIGVMFLTPASLSGVHPAIASILNNGLIVGVLICIFLEQGMKKKASARH
ncbi:purine/pyrimidine permease [Pseudalkalibacillus salsuginis]|uniref:purine/pyrimidine permease n=1 Tax=Pseudalkalibacillus salsuginis TaxID=2910972 RepID=UPI001F333D07|nr:purine/pyrimidine permease [Pseudalkalibacillus salsuginis]MCF6411227.1 purine/pyrimidine permease [Pseudalkalibacillus salsuginis]